MAGSYFDKKEQFEKIRAGLLAGERIDGVFDMKGGGTGFIGITSMRVIVYDKAFARKMKALVSIVAGADGDLPTLQHRVPADDRLLPSCGLQRSQPAA